MTSSNGNIFRVTGPLCGEYTGHRWIPRTKTSGAELWFFYDLRLNKRLSKQSWGWWFETPSRPCCRHCNDTHHAKYKTHMKPTVSVQVHSLHHQTWASIHQANGRLTARSREASKLRDSGLKFSNHSVIWQTPQQHVAGIPVKLQIDTIIIKCNLSASRLHETLRSDVLPLGE